VRFDGGIARPQPHVVGHSGGETNARRRDMHPLRCLLGHPLVLGAASQSVGGGSYTAVEFCLSPSAASATAPSRQYLYRCQRARKLALR
jgi:hypothetical protein